MAETPLDPARCTALLLSRVVEPAPGRIQLVCGPRQVGKTTSLLRLADHLGPVAIYVAADGPEAVLPGFWERMWTQAETLARRHGRAVLLIDEAHVLTDWSARLKGEWDRLRRKKIPVHVVVTGSSSLHLASGSRESLAGRFERITLTHWTAAALANAFGIARHDAIDAIVREGAYPGAFPYRTDPARWSAYVRDVIVQPAIGRDIIALAAVRKPALLRQVFGVSVTSPAQIVSLQKIQGQLQDRGALETIAHYLTLLEDAFLVAALPKYAGTEARRRAAPPKLITLSNALLAVADERGAPDVATEADRLGPWVENACLAHACNQGQTVRYWRQEPLEVDAVIDGTWGRWAVEVKTGAFRASDLRGLMEFTRRYPKYAPLLLCDPEQLPAAERLGVPAQAWQDFLWAGPPSHP